MNLFEATSGRSLLVRWSLIGVLAGLVAAAPGCGDEQPGERDDVQTYRIGGIVSTDVVGGDEEPPGFGDDQLVLEDRGETLVVEQPGDFQFERDYSDGEDYDVEVVEEPGDYQCTVQGGAGTIDGADVGDVRVECLVEAEYRGPARFTVEIDEDASRLQHRATREITVVAEVENIGGETGVGDVELEIGNRYEETRQLELTGGESASVNFEWDTEAGDQGEYVAVIATDNQSDSAPVVVDQPLPAYYEVEIDESASQLEIVEEETATVVATIHNTGDLDGERDVEFATGQFVLEEREIEVAGQSEKTVTFEWTPPIDFAGEYSIEIRTGDDSDQTELIVEALPFYDVEVDEDATDFEVVEGEVLGVEAEVVNTGDFSDERDIQLVVGDDIEDEVEELELDPGETESVSLAWETGVGDAGIHTPAVEPTGDGDSDSVSVDVLEQAEFVVGIDEAASELVVERGESVLVDAVVENTGEVDGHQDVELIVESGGEEVFAQTAEALEVPGGEEVVETFQWDTQAAEAGSYVAEVNSEDDADTADLEVLKPAYFAVDIDETVSDSSVEEGEQLVVEAEIENTGDVAGEQTVGWAVFDEDGEVVETADEKLTVGGGDREDVGLEWATEQGDAGEYTVEVSTDDASDSMEVVVEAPAYLTVEIDEQESDLEVEEHETVVLEATVENTGDVAATRDVELYVDGTLEATDELEVDPDQTERAVLQWETEAGDAGDRDATVETGDETAEVDVTVLAPAFFEVAIDDQNSRLEVEEGETVVLEATVTNTGEVSGTRDVELAVEGQGDPVAEQTVEDLELSADESTDERLEWETEYGDEGDYEAIVDSSDQVVTETVIVGDALLPADFVVDIDETAGELTVVAGETATVEATVENQGDETDTQTIELNVDGAVVDEHENLELDGQHDQEVTLEWETDEDDAGSYDGVVSSEDDVDSTEIEVQEPAYLSVDIDEEASQLVVEEGETVEVVADIENTGDVTDSQDVELVVGGDVVDEVEQLEVEGRETERVTLEWEETEDKAGSHVGEVWTSDEYDSAELEVQQSAYFAVDIDEEASQLEVEEEETALVVAQIANTGEATGERDIELSIEGTVVDEIEDFEVEGGATEYAELEWETETGDEGEHQAVVDTTDETAETTVVVDELQTVLSGILEDSETGEGLGGVTVVLTMDDGGLTGSTAEIDDETQADGSYEFEFEDFEEGEVILELEAPGLEPDYGLAEADGDSILEFELEAGYNEQDLTLDWLRTTDFVVDGGVLDFGEEDDSPVVLSTEDDEDDEDDDDDDDFRYIFEFPGCDRQSDGTYEPVGGGSLRDQIEVTFLPEDECFFVEDVDIELATGQLDMDVDEVNVPDVEFFVEDHPDDVVEAGLIEMEWIVDEVDGDVDFVGGDGHVDLDVRMLLGGEAEVPDFPAGTQWLEFGFWINEYDCQMTGAWGGDIEDPEEDEDNEQIGDYLHDPVEVRFSTTNEDGESYDWQDRVFVTVDGEFVIDRMSEGEEGADDEGGASCGDYEAGGEDFADFLNDDFNLPAEDGQPHWEFDWWLPEHLE